ncbi:WD40-like Beta Propeller Repeat [Micromonospora pallida]|uniref:WD40-like Beta Propeller Repeat n=1 Tax=Micromonospora pallida TaxID=145854 RepID=A0A1C6T9Y4_9ACTN|nr:cell wall-binding repeat-containing protein [Micromonospora pallida]SCL38489.1 WD40-like Beta Propeller Repeat [Micromonospora pallida]
MPAFFRRSVALASALAVGSSALVAGGTGAAASLPGSNNVLTTSNGGTSIAVFNSSQTVVHSPVPEAMKEVSWSPDGSMASYVDPDNGISMVRWNGFSAWYQVPPTPNVVRSSPVWRGTGGSVVWAEKPSGAPWRIRYTTSTSGVDFGAQLSPADGKHYRNPDTGPDLRVVFQRQDDNGGQPGGVPAVLLYDPSKPQAERITVIDDNGSNPAFSPDGTKVAFVRNGQIVVSDLAGENEVVVTSNAAAHDHPTWSPDGRTIAFRQGSGVAQAAADGSQAALPTVVTSSGNGIPAYRPQNKDRAARLAGTNRFTTAVRVSQSHWKTTTDAADRREQASSVVLSRSDTFADALSGSALAAAKRGPLLMTQPTILDVDTSTEIQRVLAPGGTVYLLGSPGAISTGVEDAVRALGFTVKRVAGQDRFSTSVAIAKEIDPTPDLVLLSTGMNFPDALAAGAAAGSYNTPGSTTSAVVLLTNESVMPASTKAFLDTLPANDRTIFGIGRFATQAATRYDADAVPVWGNNRYETAAITGWTFFGGQHYAGIATGLNWPDALSGGALMAVLNGPLLLTPGTAPDLGLDAEIALDFASGSIRTALVFGSAPVVSDRQLQQAGQWISGPLGASVVVNPTDVGLTARTGAESRAAATAGQPSVRTPEEAAAAARSLPKRLGTAG